MRKIIVRTRMRTSVRFACNPYIRVFVRTSKDYLPPAPFRARDTLAPFFSVRGTRRPRPRFFGRTTFFLGALETRHSSNSDSWVPSMFQTHIRTHTQADRTHPIPSHPIPQKAPAPATRHRAGTFASGHAKVRRMHGLTPPRSPQQPPSASSSPTTTTQGRNPHPRN
jgi:hypothetical protein